MQYSDPGGGGAIESAMAWLQAAFAGPLATTLAVIAVANLGFLMLAGRLEVRRGLQVVLGCFLLFGASGIAEGIIGAVSGIAQPQIAEPVPPPPRFAHPPQTQPSSSSPFDPYAGAAVPQY